MTMKVTNSNGNQVSASKTIRIDTLDGVHIDAKEYDGSSTLSGNGFSATNITLPNGIIIHVYGKEVCVHMPYAEGQTETIKYLVEGGNLCEGLKVFFDDEDKLLKCSECDGTGNGIADCDACDGDGYAK